MKKPDRNIKTLFIVSAISIILITLITTLVLSQNNKATGADTASVPVPQPTVQPGAQYKQCPDGTIVHKTDECTPQKEKQLPSTPGQFLNPSNCNDPDGSKRGRAGEDIFIKTTAEHQGKKCTDSCSSTTFVNECTCATIASGASGQMQESTTLVQYPKNCPSNFCSDGACTKQYCTEKEDGVNVVWKAGDKTVKTQDLKDGKCGWSSQIIYVCGENGRVFKTGRSCGMITSAWQKYSESKNFKKTGIYKKEGITERPVLLTL